MAYGQTEWHSNSCTTSFGENVVICDCDTLNSYFYGVVNDLKIPLSVVAAQQI